MKLGQKVIFQKELKKKCNISESETLEFLGSVGAISPRNLEKIRKGAKYLLPNWGIYDNKKHLKGIIAGVRNIDITGSMDYEDGYIHGNKLKVYLIATNLRGFHRVPDDFILETLEKEQGTENCSTTK